jgi:hypothetical protein
MEEKWKVVKEIKVYIHNKSLEQVATMEYLGTIKENKFKFCEHISYAAERYTKLIHSLTKSAKHFAQRQEKHCASRQERLLLLLNPKR